MVLNEAIRKFNHDGFTALFATALYRISPSLGNQICATLVSTRGPIITHHGVVLDISVGEYRSELLARFLRGYEAKERWVIDEVLDGSVPVIELGGGIGFIANYIDYCLNENTPHVVVEPNADNLEALRRNRHLNGSNYRIKHHAYSSTSETIDLQLTGLATTAHSATDGDDDTVTIDAVSLSSLLSDVAADEVQLVIDIEGTEAELFNQELDLLEERCQIFIVEFHNNESEIQQVLADSYFEPVNRYGSVVAFENRKKVDRSSQYDLR